MKKQHISTQLPYSITNTTHVYPALFYKLARQPGSLLLFRIFLMYGVIVCLPLICKSYVPSKEGIFFGALGIVVQ